MLPRIASKSAIISPLLIFGTICKWGNEGVRMRVRYETVFPSLIK